jgi:hypothetical protein
MHARARFVVNFVIAVVTTGAADIFLFLNGNEADCTKRDHRKQNVFHVRLQVETLKLWENL